MNRLTAYVGEKLTTGTAHTLTDWHGKPIGTCYFNKGWKVRSCIGDRMYQIYATVDGVHYTGRGFGKGMCVNLREVRS